MVKKKMNKSNFKCLTYRDAPVTRYSYPYKEISELPYYKKVTNRENPSHYAVFDQFWVKAEEKKPHDPAVHF